MLKEYYLLLGSNLGDSVNIINKTINDIAKQLGDVSKQSTFHTSEAWGFESTNIFYNIAILVKSDLEPFAFLHRIQEIETNNGRIRTSREWTDRLIDIDILLIDNMIINKSPELIVPHKLLAQRLFALKPLNQIASELEHPILKKSINELLNECEAKLL